MTKRDGKYVTQIRLEDELYEKLTALVDHFDYPEKGGRSKVISTLIQRAEIKDSEIIPKELISQQELDAIREQYADLSRVGNNLNQLTHLVQLERVEFEHGERQNISVNVKKLIEILKDLDNEVVDTKQKILKLLELA